jgi:uroporphyrinogen decarboxylase
MDMAVREWTPRERFIAALERRPLPGLVPTFELVYFLTMESFGKVHPSHRSYHQWLQMSEVEREAHIDDMARLYIATAERFGHHALFLHPNPSDVDSTAALVRRVRELSGSRYFVMLHGDATLAIPDGAGMEEMSLRMVEEPEQVDAQAVARVKASLTRADELVERLGPPGSGMSIDGFALCSDYCFNEGPFLPPAWFDRFITPHLHEVTRQYKRRGFYVIKHTDGNIMPILDRLVPDDEASRPHALHSLDPQGNVDMASIVDAVADKVCLCGNVHCGLMQTGTDEQMAASARYAIEHGLRAPGYVFSTSNCVYTGMPLRSYELILDVYRRHAVRR